MVRKSDEPQVRLSDLHNSEREKKNQNVSLWFEILAKFRNQASEKDWLKYKD